ncbi:MAG: hypothetical protein IPQ18_08285 [Saprospiraceae bacterium]|nr:hypothetical protein [Saprospiraceae bacterium]
MTNNQSYFKSVLYSTGLNVVSKLIVFLNTIILAYFFGTGEQTDIYFYLISVIGFATSFLGILDYTVIIPEMIKTKEQEGSAKANLLGNTFLGIYFLFGIIMLVIVFINPVSFFSFFSPYDHEHLNKYYDILILGGILIFFFQINNLLSAILTSYKYFIVPIVISIINSLLSIIFTSIFSESYGIRAAVYGLLIGYLINFIVLIILFDRMIKWDFLKIHISLDKRVLMNSGLIIINFIPVNLRNYISIYLLNSMPSGTYSAFNLAQNVSIVPEVFIVSQVLSVFGIKFSELYAKNQKEELGKTVEVIFTILLLILFPIALIVYFSADSIIEFLYYRGEFKLKSLEITALCLTFFAFLIPFRMPDALFTRLFTSIQLYKTTVPLGAIAHIIIAGLMYFLTTEYGLRGYFYSMIIGYGFIMPFVFYLIGKLKAEYIFTKGLIQKTLIVIFATLLLFFIITFLLHFFKLEGFTKLIVIFSIVVSSFIFLTLNLTREYHSFVLSYFKSHK